MKQFFNVWSLLIILAIGLLVSCNDDKPLEGSRISRDTKSSIFVTIQTKHVGNVDIRYTFDTIHNENGSIVKVIAHIDTIPQMSMTKDTLGTGRTYTNSDGDEYEKDTVIIHPKDYQMYISVKN